MNRLWNAQFWTVSKFSPNGCGKQPYLDQWWLPDELVTLLRDYFENVEPLDGLAFRTRESLSLVTEDSDSVRQWFDDVRNSAEITRTGVSFYTFRRFLGDRAKRKGGAASAGGGTLIATQTFASSRAFTMGLVGGTFDVNASRTLTLSSGIGANGNLLTKSGSGTLILFAASTRTASASRRATSW